MLFLKNDFFSLGFTMIEEDVVLGAAGVFAPV
jgi:hypothetical protein